MNRKQRKEDERIGPRRKGKKGKTIVTTPTSQRCHPYRRSRGIEKDEKKKKATWKRQGEKKETEAKEKKIKAKQNKEKRHPNQTWFINFCRINSCVTLSIPILSRYPFTPPYFFSKKAIISGT